MVCWCCSSSSEESNAQNDNAQEQKRNTPKAPSQINMSRGDPAPILDEDIQAVKAWRDSRNTTSRYQYRFSPRDHHTQKLQESDPPIQRTQRLGTPEKSKMATLDSIEVDELSTISSSLKYTPNHLPTIPNNTLPLRHNEDQGIRRPVTAPPVPSAFLPTRSQASDDQSLGTIDGSVSDKVGTPSKFAENRQTPSPSSKKGGQRMWSPTTAPVSQSSHGTDFQAPRSEPFEITRSRSTPTIQKDGQTPERFKSSPRDTSKRPEQPSHLRRLRSGSNTLETRIQEDLKRRRPDLQLSDSLSDLPSDVDTEVREQYLLACRLLKTTMVQKEKTLDHVEKDFLHKLVQDVPFVPSESQIAAVKKASETLMSDPLFRSSSKPASEDFNGSLRESGQAANLKDDMYRKKKAVAAYAKDEAKNYPFRVLGNAGVKFEVLTPRVMEQLRGFLPMSIAEENFWLKFSFDRDGGSLMTLLSRVRTSKHTILAVETTSGFVFGVFCSTHWRVQRSWFGSEECFLWRLKHSRRRTNRESRSHLNDNEMEVYPYTGHDDLVQFVTNKTLAVGGGDWHETEANPFPREPTGIGFTIDGDLLGGETNSCATFASPRLCGRLTNNTEFEIESLEVWTLTPCNTVEEAETLETRRFFVESSDQKQA